MLWWYPMVQFILVMFLTDDGHTCYKMTILWNRTSIGYHNIGFWDPEDPNKDILKSFPVVFDVEILLKKMAYWPSDYWWNAPFFTVWLHPLCYEHNSQIYPRLNWSYIPNLGWNSKLNSNFNRNSKLNSSWMVDPSGEYCDAFATFLIRLTHSNTSYYTPMGTYYCLCIILTLWHNVT